MSDAKFTTHKKVILAGLIMDTKVEKGLSRFGCYIMGRRHLNEKGSLMNEGLMRKGLIIIVCTVFLWCSLAFAAGPKAYQVTGPVFEIKGDAVVVKKSKDKRDLLMDEATRRNSDLKVGTKVTVMHTTKATFVEVNGLEN